MRLEAICHNCNRRFLVAQIKPEPDGTGGRCPFCGIRFARHYVQTLPRVLDAAEQAADTFVSALEQLSGMHPGFQIEYGAMLKRMSDELAQPSERAAQPA